MIRSRLLWRIFGATTALVLVSSALAWFVGSRRIAEEVERETSRSLRAKASLLAEIARPVLAGAGDRGALERRLVALSPSSGTRLSVISLDGKVLADSARDPETMEPHLPDDRRPELKRALHEGRGGDRRRSASVREEMMYEAVRVDDGGRPIGFVRTAIPLTAEADLLALLRSDLAFAAAIATVVGLGLAWLLARRIAGPVAAMTDAAAAIAAGDYARRVPSRSDDEVGRLASTFNEMAAQMAERVEAISRGRRELAGVLGGMVEGVVAVDGEGRLVLWNEAARRILDAAEPSIGRPVFEVTRLRDVVDVLEEAMRSGKPSVREVRLPRSPRDRFLRLHAGPLGDGSRSAGAVLVVHDVSELRQLESVRREFVANVSHELKTPLAAIRGYVETVLDDPTMAGEVRQRFLGRARDQALRMARMTDELLLLSRVESAPSEVVRAPTDMTAAVRESVAAVQPAANEKGLQVEVALPGDPLVVLANEEALRRIAGNLLDNAVKYTPEAGTVRVRLDEREGEAVLEVEDTGPGIPERERERVFERFYRVDKGRSRDAGGTGLGLAIVKHLARALGGAVSVEGAPGGGSVFRVRIPVRAP